MTEALMLTGALLVVAGLTVTLAVERRRRQQARGWLAGATRRRMLVHTRDGQTLSGQLVREDVDGLVLSPARLEEGPHDLDGSVWVPRRNVHWVQLPGGDDG